MKNEKWLLNVKQAGLSYKRLHMTALAVVLGMLWPCIEYLWCDAAFQLPHQNNSLTSTMIGSFRWKAYVIILIAIYSLFSKQDLYTGVLRTLYIYAGDGPPANA